MWQHHCKKQQQQRRRRRRGCHQWDSGLYRRRERVSTFLRVRMARALQYTLLYMYTVLYSCTGVPVQ
jgi:hypothetical protein